MRLGKFNSNSEERARSNSGERARQRLAEIRKATERSEHKRKSRDQSDLREIYSFFRNLVIHPTENGIVYLGGHQKPKHLQLFEIAQINSDAAKTIMSLLTFVPHGDLGDLFRDTFTDQELFFIFYEVQKIIYLKVQSNCDYLSTIKDKADSFLRKASGMRHYGVNALLMYRIGDVTLLKDIDKLLKCEYENDAEFIIALKQFADNYRYLDKAYLYEKTDEALKTAYGTLVGIAKDEILKNKVFPLIESLK